MINKNSCFSGITFAITVLQEYIVKSTKNAKSGDRIRELSNKRAKESILDVRERNTNKYNCRRNAP